MRERNGVLWMYDVCGCLALEDYGGVVISGLKSIGKVSGASTTYLKIKRGGKPPHYDYTSTRTEGTDGKKG